MGCNASRSTDVREQSRRKAGQPLKPMNGKVKASSSPSNKPVVRQSAITAAIFGEQDHRSPRFHSAPTLSSSMDDDHTPMSGLTVNTSRRPSIDDSVSPTVLTSSPAGVKSNDHHPLASAKFLRNLTEGEQFRIGLKLSAQEQQYGTNMFDSLQQSDLPELERLVATGVTYEDAATYIFERRFQSIHHTSHHDRHVPVESNMHIARKPLSLAIDEPALLQLPGMSGGTYFDPIVPTTTTTHQNRSHVDEIPQFVPFASFGKKKTSPKSMFSNNSIVPVVQQQQSLLHSEVTSAASPAAQQPRVLHGGHVFYQGKWLSPRQRMALQEQELYLQHHQQRQQLQQQWQGQIPGQQVIWHQNVSSVPANANYTNNRPYLQQMLQAPKAHLISGAHQDITQGSPLYMSSYNQQQTMNDMDIYPHSYA